MLTLALETSCDETAVALVDAAGHVRASEISSQIERHRATGGVVPEVASREHIRHVRPVLDAALAQAGVSLRDIGLFAATAGPGLASSLLIGLTVAKTLALAHAKPFLAVNHLEGHLLSPFLGRTEIPPHVSLVVSGGHTLLLDVTAIGRYELLGRTRDDAAGEAFDKVGKMLSLPYPGGPEIDRLAATGNPTAFDFPRSMRHSGDFHFSFSGLKTAVLYTLRDLGEDWSPHLPNLCASFQAAVVEILVEKTIAAARAQGRSIIAVSGGVSCNRGLRAALQTACVRAGLDLRLTAPAYTTDNAAMIAFAAALKFAAGETTPLSADIHPNLSLTGDANRSSA